MSDKMYSNRSTNSQQAFGVQYPIRTTVPTAAVAPASGNGGHPVFVEGDTEGETVGAYMSLQRGATGPVAAGWTGSAGGPTGITGIYVVHTNAPFAGFNAGPPVLVFKGANGTLGVEMLTPKQNSDGTWDIPYRVFALASGTATDLPVGAGFETVLFLRNSRIKP